LAADQRRSIPEVFKVIAAFDLSPIPAEKARPRVLTFARRPTVLLNDDSDAEFVRDYRVLVMSRRCSHDAARQRRRRWSAH
jgi:hypothetical protein